MYDQPINADELLFGAIFLFWNLLALACWPIFRDSKDEPGLRVFYAVLFLPQLLVILLLSAIWTAAGPLRRTEECKTAAYVLLILFILYVLGIVV